MMRFAEQALAADKWLQRHYKELERLERAGVVKLYQDSVVVIDLPRYNKSLAQGDIL